MIRFFPVLRNVMAVVGVLALCGHAVHYAASRFEWFPWVWEESMRIASPEGTSDVVIYRGNRGAMSSYRYAYFVVPRGEKVNPASRDGFDTLLVCSSPIPQPVWVGAQKLLIPYEGNQVFHFQPQPRGSKVIADLIDQRTLSMAPERPNKAPEPTPGPVTPRASSGGSK